MPKREFSTTQAGKTRKTRSVEPMLSRRVYRYLQLGSFTLDEIHDRFYRISKYQQHQQMASSPAVASTAITDKEDDENDATTSTTDTANANDFINSIQVRKYIEQRILLLEQDSQDYYVNKTYDSNEEDRTDQIRQEYITTETEKFLRFFAPNVNNNEIAAATYLKDKDAASSADDVIILTKDQFTMKIIESASSVDFTRSWPITVSMLLIGSSVGVVVRYFFFAQSANVFHFFIALSVACVVSCGFSSPYKLPH